MRRTSKKTIPIPTDQPNIFTLPRGSTFLHTISATPHGSSRFSSQRHCTHKSSVRILLGRSKYVHTTATSALPDCANA